MRSWEVEYTHPVEPGFNHGPRCLFWLVLEFSSSFRLSAGPPDIFPRSFGWVWDILAIHNWEWQYSRFHSMQRCWFIFHTLCLGLKGRYLLGIVRICWVLLYCWLWFPLWEIPPLCRSCLVSFYSRTKFFPTGISMYLRSTSRCSSCWGSGNC